jgi:hypothetical protein
MSDQKQPEKKKVPVVAGFDRGPKDFFRGSRGFAPKGGRSFIGMRRGSR